jgi:O-antigen/teichoic acid export membrane protein
MWSVMAEICSRIVPPLSLVVLARLLSPADFGVVGAAAVVVSFAAIFWDTGMGQAFIQRRHDHEAAANIVFWTNLTLAGVLYSGLVVSAGWIAQFFGDERIRHVLWVQGLVLLPSAAAAVFAADRRKTLDFKGLFWMRLTTSGIPIVSSVPLAMGGWGYWALIAGNLASAVLGLFVLWRGSSLKIGWGYNIAVAREMFVFGKFAMGEALLGWLYAWGDSLLIGRYFSTDELGVYRAANSVVAMVFAITVAPVFPVLFPLFSRLQQPGAIRRRLLEVVAAVSAISWMIGVMFAFNGDLIAALALGGKWTGAASMIAGLGVINGISYYSLAGHEAMRATGQVRAVFIMLFTSLSYSVPLWIWSVRSGVEFFLLVRLLLMIPGHALMFYFFRRHLGITPIEWLANLKGSVGAVFLLAVGVFGLGRCQLPLFLHAMGMLALAALYLTYSVRRSRLLGEVFETLKSRLLKAGR